MDSLSTYSLGIGPKPPRPSFLFKLKMPSSSHPQIPPTFGRARIIVLLACLLTALSAGTNYVFSGVALTEKSSVRTPVGRKIEYKPYEAESSWSRRKRVVDARGPKSLLLSGFILLLIGYSGIQQIYNAGLPENTTTLSVPMLVLLIACSFMTGVGGNGGLAAAINTTAKSFPDKVRGSMNGLVISGFGLSAFLFSAIAHQAFPGDTSSFLLILALGTSFPMLIGFIFIRPIPLPPSEIPHNHIDVDSAEADTASLAPSVISSPFRENINDSRTYLLSHDESLEAGVGIGHRQIPTTAAEEYVPDARTGIELSPPRLGVSPSPRSSFGRAGSPGVANGHRRSSSRPSFSQGGRLLLETGPNLYGKKLWMSIDFWIPFISMSLLPRRTNGSGPVDINNVGSMAQALYANKNVDGYSEIDAAQWQAAQVSTISFMNFAGRIVIGLLSDFVKSRFNLPRSTLLILVAFILLLSQIAASFIGNVQGLWRASALLGLGYGTHFSENWGYLSLSPLLGGNIFSVAFGRNLDAHERDPNKSTSSLVSRLIPSTLLSSLAPPPSSPSSLTSSSTSLSSLSSSSSTSLPSQIPARQCLQGLDCYVDSLKLTMAACVCAIGLSVWMVWRDRRRALEMDKEGFYKRLPEVIWEEDGEEEGDGDEHGHGHGDGGEVGGNVRRG
ncbi:hypothetical protein D9757_013761 [Collybiopsis confluens]|uniref:MFS general substrate transporter n=1 Tax=Collybiopsis confluens TaxID=2823264 RepID=A0A8H5D2W8_9AGAR|nr:hypothetical protein D9757_013761 [Collybiopsis confluens]